MIDIVIDVSCVSGLPFTVS